MSHSRTLRSGYTTGACAAAAARAAALALLNQQAVTRVATTLPGGHETSFAIKHCTFSPDEASCSVIKDAGDDPDVTDGIEVFASVRWNGNGGITLCGGKGVGTVTKPGLEIAIGQPAITAVPRQMILLAVAEAMGSSLNGKGFTVTISAPEGELLAKRTLNARLGISGGISILGTTGIVIPYSKEAYTACIARALDVAVAAGCRQAVLTTGRRSERFAQKALALPEESFIQAGDFIDFSLVQCAAKGLVRVIVWGMVGKISKLAAGHLYTNVSDSVVSIDLLADLAAACGITEEKLASLRKAITANHFRKLLPAEYTGSFYASLCRLAAEKCAQYVGGKLTIECVLTDPEGAILGRGHAP